MEKKDILQLHNLNLQMQGKNKIIIFRKCLPCYDEPSIKTQFEVTLIVPEDRIALSNMDCISGNSLVQENADGNKKKTVKFCNIIIKH
jgi:aminopeptidase N